MGGGQSVLADADLVKHAHESGLKVFAGFKAEENRLLYLHEDKFPNTPLLVTILPSGVIEGDAAGKKIPPAKDRGLLTYPKEQLISAVLAKPLLEKPLCKPYLFQKDEQYAMVQLWTVNVNESFRKEFTMNDDNPDEAKFKPEAVAALTKAAAALWNVDEKVAAEGHKVKYCSKSTQNIDRTYIGTSVTFKKFLAIEGVMASLGIQSVSDNDIIVSTVDKKGNKGTQTFTWGDSETAEQVLYKRNGFTSFMCVKSRTQFEEDCHVHGEITA